MSSVRIEFNGRAIDALLKSDEVMGALRAEGEKILARTGTEDFELQEWVGANRARVTVRTSTWRGRYREAQYRTLTNAIGGS